MKVGVTQVVSVRLASVQGFRRLIGLANGCRFAKFYALRFKEHACQYYHIVMSWDQRQSTTNDNSLCPSPYLVPPESASLAGVGESSREGGFIRLWMIASLRLVEK